MSALKEVLTLSLLLQFFSSEAQIQDSNLNFYLDSKVNCRGDVYDLSKRRAYVYGNGGKEATQGLNDCYLSLKSETDVIASNTKLEIEVVQLLISDCDVTLTIHDGGPEQLLLGSYDCHTGKKQDKLFSTGNKISIVLKRRSVDTTESRYDIKLIVTPLYTGRDPDPGAPSSGGGDEYIRFEKRIPTEAILGIVGGLLVITVIVIVTVTVICYRKHRGDDKPWVENKLSYINTSVNDDSRSAHHNTRMWASQNSPVTMESEPYTKRPPSYEESVFDDIETLPRKRPVYHESDHRSGSDHNTRARSKHPGFRPRDDSFVQADDDHPQDSYQERVIQPRVRSAPRRWVAEDEQDEEVDTEQRKNHWAEAGSVDENDDDAVEERSGQDEESEEEEDEAETEESDTDTSEDEAEHKPASDKENKTLRRNQNPAPQMPYPPPQFAPQRKLPPVHIPPHNMMVRAPPPPQFVVYPVPVGTNQFVPMSSMATGPVSNPPAVSHHSQPPSPKLTSHNRPTYSHLVQRGYNPQAGRDTPISRSTPVSGGSDSLLQRSRETDLSEPDLTCGVELMRR